MPLYEVSGRSTLTTATAGAVLFGFVASGQVARILEIQFFNSTAPTTSGGLGLARQTAAGTGAATSIAAQKGDPRDGASTSIAYTNYATLLPTTGGVTTTLKRWHHGTAIGNGGSVWTWDRLSPLIVDHTTAATAGIAIINLQATAAATYDFSFRWIE